MSEHLPIIGILALMPQGYEPLFPGMIERQGGYVKENPS